MDPALQARIDAVAKELIQLAHQSGETIFIAAGLNGSPGTDAVLIVSTDPPRARALEGAFEAVSRRWAGAQQTAYDAEGRAGPAEPAPSESEDEGVLGLN